MSYMTLYSVPKEGELKEEKEFHNAHLGAHVIWMMLCDKYIDDEYYLQQSHTPKLWKLSKDERLPVWERIVLMTTYDKVIVKLENLPKVIWAMNKFYEEYKTRYPDKGCHLPEHAKELQRIFDEGTAFGVCWNQTSVCDGVWYVYDTCECCGQDLVESRLFDMSKEKDSTYGAWLLFEVGDIEDFEIDEKEMNK
ncbi:MAG: hypothetical protein ACTSSE_16055 [Candidatus Thorarchaeota archaeon]